MRSLSLSKCPALIMPSRKRNIKGPEVIVKLQINGYTIKRERSEQINDSSSRSELND